MYRIEIDEDCCIGCGGCTSCDNFEIVDGTSRPIKAEIATMGCTAEAVQICPAKAIRITEFHK